jgi:hypothetical protein
MVHKGQNAEADENTVIYAYKKELKKSPYGINDYSYVA